MTEAIFGFVGVIVGAVASAGTTLWVTRWTQQQQTKREDVERHRGILYDLQAEIVLFTEASAQLLVNSTDPQIGIRSVIALDRIQMAVIRAGDQELSNSYRDLRNMWYSANPATDRNAWEIALHAIANGPMASMKARINALINPPSATSNSFSSAPLPPDSSPDQPVRRDANG